MRSCLECGRRPNVPSNPWCRNCVRNRPTNDSSMNFIEGDNPEQEVYIAGPFFNPEQVLIVEEIESILDAAGITYFSPMREGGVVADNPNLKARDVFRNDCLGIVRCKWVLCIGVYVGVELARIDNATGTQHTVYVPDTGTVWEAGFATALGKPVVGYAPVDTPTHRINLMLTECWSHVCYGHEELRLFVAGNFRKQSWKGGAR